MDALLFPLEPRDHRKNLANLSKLRRRRTLEELPRSARENSRSRRASYSTSRQAPVPVPVETVEAALDTEDPEDLAGVFHLRLIFRAMMAMDAYMKLDDLSEHVNNDAEPPIRGGTDVYARLRQLAQQRGNLETLEARRKKNIMEEALYHNVLPCFRGPTPRARTLSPHSDRKQEMETHLAGPGMLPAPRKSGVTRRQSGSTAMHAHRQRNSLVTPRYDPLPCRLSPGANDDGRRQIARLTSSGRASTPTTNAMQHPPSPTVPQPDFRVSQLRSRSTDTPRPPHAVYAWINGPMCSPASPASACRRFRSDGSITPESGEKVRRGLLASGSSHAGSCRRQAFEAELPKARDTPRFSRHSGPGSLCYLGGQLVADAGGRGEHTKHENSKEKNYHDIVCSPTSLLSRSPLYAQDQSFSPEDLLKPILSSEPPSSLRRDSFAPSAAASTPTTVGQESSSNALSPMVSTSLGSSVVACSEHVEVYSPQRHAPEEPPKAATPPASPAPASLLPSPPKRPVRGQRRQSQERRTIQGRISPTSASQDPAEEICATRSLPELYSVCSNLDVRRPPCPTCCDGCKDQMRCRQRAEQRAFRVNIAGPTEEHDGTEDPRIIPKLFDALQQNTHLEEVMLGNTGLLSKKEHVEKLSKALRVNRTLRKLDIQANFFKMSDLKSIFDAVADNQSLEELKVNNQVSEEGDFSELLQTQVGTEVYKSAEAMLQKSRRLRTLDLELLQRHYRDVIGKLVLRKSEERRKEKLKAKKLAELDAHLCNSVQQPVS
eukprot:TRINITY_DN16055_c0_g1_i2.p1 TRINITY_DN16055_c0_g1~~TRINITY_DN16055_c0_g1_i2.p1  ORF type:complete len:787 (-),score=141.68 TRINITY_DN16055_c0_g1_i2:6-2327(-)